MNNIATVSVDLKDKPYKIRIGENLSKSIKALVDDLSTKKRNCYVITDNNIKEHYEEFIEDVFGEIPVFALEPAESSKSFTSFEAICDFLLNNGADRQSCIFTLGGGVVGDVSAFAAATYMRGIDYYQIPTTLLSMVDSAIGGKTGINLSFEKNLVGAVHPPKGVFINRFFLFSLDKAEFASGIAEIIKAGLLGDKSLWESLLSMPALSAESDNILKIIQKSCELKAKVILTDELEQDRTGGRMFLNLGHTFGHALEILTKYQKYKHGEAVSIGLVLASRYSEELGKLNSQEVQSIKILLGKYNLPTQITTPLASEALLKQMYNDKKIVSGQLLLVGLESLGKACIIRDVNEQLVKFLWKEVGAT